MKHSLRLLAVCTLLVITSITSAQIDINSSEVQAAIRVKHDRSSILPDGIAFRETIRFLKYRYEKDPAIAVKWVTERMGLSVAEAHDFVNHAVNTLHAIESENQRHRGEAL